MALRNVEDFYPLSPMQQGMLFHSLVSSQADTYCQQADLHLKGNLDQAAMVAAWQNCVRRHPILRTSFVWKGLPEPVQVVNRSVDLLIEFEDWRELDELEQERRFGLRLADVRQQGFDLSKAPLMRLEAFQTGEEDWRLVWTYHHILLDGWSAVRVLTETFLFYEGLVLGRPVQLPPSPSYRDYIAWLAQRDLASSERFWREELAGFTAATPLVVERRDQASQAVGDSVATETLELTKQETEALRAFARSAGLTLNTLVQAAWALLLSRYSGEEDVVFGATVAGRPEELVDSTEMVGVFINTLPVRVSASPQTRLIPWLKELQSRQSEARQYYYTPLFQIQSWSDVAGEAPLFESIVVFANYEESGNEAGVEGLRIVERRSWESSNYALNMFAEPAERLILGGVYDRKRFDIPTMRRMLRHWGVLLGSMVERPQGCIGDLAITAVEERRTLLFDWNATDEPVSDADGIHHLFEQRVEESPQSIAVTGIGHELTYAQLNTRSNRLARTLIDDCRVARGGFVAIYMNRSPDLVVALLAVLKSGAAYVPIDLDWPTNRASAILAELGVGAIITESTLSRKVHDIRSTLPALTDVVYLDVRTEEAEPEPIDVVALSAFWDRIAGTTSDRASMGGFVSSYTGYSFTDQEIDEYVDRVCDLVESKISLDARVLEIGCGSGEVLFRIASKVRRYVGLDPSEMTQRRNRERVVKGGVSSVALLSLSAHELLQAGDAGSFDLVIIASVAQFFPGPQYLAQVVDDALRLLAPGGRIVFADLLDPRQKDAFELSLLSSSTASIRDDAEFYVGPDFFHRLASRDARIASVVEKSRDSGFSTELKFRYDVIIEKSAAPAETEQEFESRSVAAWTRHHIDRRSGENVTGRCHSQDTAYVIYTSGSTGTPKGVLLQHQPVMNLIAWVNKTYEVGRQDRLLWVTSPCFDLSVYDVFGVLAAGGSVRVAIESEIRDPEELCRILRTEPITFWDSAPAALQRLTPWFEPTGSSDTHLRLAFLSGDWIPLALPDALKSAFPGVRVIGLGGATEAAIWSNSFEIDDILPEWKSIPYGRPIQNARYYVLDARLQACPVGVPGDLYIGGQCLSAGYVADAETTAAKFIPDPFANELGSRLYRTGDRARFFDDGNIEFLGRLDHQVKVRGYRIETGEIEAVLSRHSMVRSAVVIARDDDANDRRLAAYLLLGDESVAADALRRFLRRELPEYMIPSSFVFLDSFPVTPNGKLDRQALPAPVQPTQSTPVADRPRTELEDLIANAWRETLSLDVVGINDNFFDVGGHSLLLVRLHGKLNDALDGDVSVIDLFQFPTVASLAEHISGTTLEEPETVPLLPAQTRRTSQERSRRLRAGSADRGGQP